MGMRNVPGPLCEETGSQLGDPSCVPVSDRAIRSSLSVGQRRASRRGPPLRDRDVPSVDGVDIVFFSSYSSANVSGDETTETDSTEQAPPSADVSDEREDRAAASLEQLREAIEGDDGGDADAPDGADDAGTNDLEYSQTGDSDGDFQFQKLLWPDDEDGVPKLAGAAADPPYLETLDAGFVVEALVIEWLGQLAEEHDPETAVEAVVYCDEIGWITPEVRQALLTYLDGIVDVDAVATTLQTRPVTFDPEEHLESLEYVYRIAQATGSEVSDDGF